MRHVGDLGNIFADKHGRAKIRIIDSIVKLTGPFNVIGRGIVIHVGRDDYGLGGKPKSLANGNSGPRLACCVIRMIATK